MRKRVTYCDTCGVVSSGEKGEIEIFSISGRKRGGSETPKTLNIDMCERCIGYLKSLRELAR